MKDDPECNIKFVQVIERHTCLYDNSKDGYSRRDITDKVWEELGKEVNESGKYNSLPVALPENTALSVPSVQFTFYIIQIVLFHSTSYTVVTFHI
jgi:hypothetical protein